MNNRVSTSKYENCTKEIVEKIEETREKLNKIYASDASYEEKMEVSRELDEYIVEAQRQMAKDILE